MSNLLRIMLIVVVCFSLFISCRGPKGSTDLNSLLGLVTGNANLSTLTGLLSGAGLGDLLGGSSPVTLLAPSNEAFAALGADALADLKNPANVEALTGLLKNHVVPGSLSVDDIAKGTGLENVLGSSLEVGKGGDGQTTVGGADIIESVQGSNGYVHVIDKVLSP